MQISMTFLTTTWPIQNGGKWKVTHVLMDGWFLTIVKLPIFMIFCAFKLVWTSSLKLKLTAVSTRRVVLVGMVFWIAGKKLVKMGIYPDAKRGTRFCFWLWPRVCACLSKHRTRQKKYLTSGKDVNPGGTHYSNCFQSQFWRTCRSSPATIDLLVLFSRNFSRKLADKSLEWTWSSCTTRNSINSCESNGFQMKN